MHIELNQEQIAGIRSKLVQELVERLTGTTVAGALPSPGTYLSRYDAIVGGYIRSLDGQGLDAVLVPADAKGQPVILEEVEYGCYGTNVSGANSEDDGEANTKALAAAGSLLAQKMLELKAALPAKAELMTSWANIRSLFPQSVFWSSTQDDSHNAWGQFFEYGYVNYWSKDSTNKAFPVRRVSASSL